MEPFPIPIGQGVALLTGALNLHQLRMVRKSTRKIVETRVLLLTALNRKSRSETDVAVAKNLNNNGRFRAAR